jgi:hypothetical protein
MARPESTRDIELDVIEFASIELKKIATDPALLKGYTAFVEAATKAGATVTDTPYSGVSFTRPPFQSEQQKQLQIEQERWDYGKKLYDTYAAVGDLENNYERNRAEEWAKSEDLPWPPEVEESLPIPTVEDTIESIDEVLA